MGQVPVYPLLRSRTDFTQQLNALLAALALPLTHEDEGRRRTPAAVAAAKARWASYG